MRVKKIFIILALALQAFTLASCVKERIDGPTKPTIDIDGPNISDDESDSTASNDNNGTGSEDGSRVEENIFKVSLKIRDEIYIPKKDEVINVIWDGVDGARVIKQIEADGYARCKDLDGDYFVHLDKAPEGYSYNPNNVENYVNNDYRDLEIKLTRTSRPKRGTGTGFYSKSYEMSDTGYYRAIVGSSTKKVYYKFVPKRSGTYYFESIVDSYADIVNPRAEIYLGSDVYVNVNNPLKVVDDGGFSLPDGFTKNFKFEFMVREEELGNVYTFTIMADKRKGSYPAEVDFICLHSDEYDIFESFKGVPVKALELDKAEIKRDFSGMTLYNADGGTGSYYIPETTNGTGILDGTKVKYKEDEGIYYKYDKETDTYITPLVAFISTPCPFYPNDPQGALNGIQSAGNSALTVKDKDGNKYNYTEFIEGDYTSIAKNGMTYVTKELRDFLQMFSNTQLIFRDGFGWCEGFGVYAKGEDQWLFACGYYL